MFKWLGIIFSLGAPDHNVVALVVPQVLHPSLASFSY